jgi:hypothetical protein
LLQQNSHCKTIPSSLKELIEVKEGKRKTLQAYCTISPPQPTILIYRKLAFLKLPSHHAVIGHPAFPRLLSTCSRLKSSTNIKNQLAGKLSNYATRYEGRGRQVVPSYLAANEL